MAKNKLPSIGKRIKWTSNADGTFTARMEWLRRADEVTVGVDDIRKVEELFSFFGIDSAKALKPLQSDRDLMATNPAQRMYAEEKAR